MSKIVGRAHPNLQRRKLFANHAHQRGIFRSAAGDNKLAKARRARALPLSSSGRTNLRTAIPIERAVSAVAVATMSFWSARRQRRRNSRTNSRPNCSRPAVLGGFCRKKGWRSNSLQHALDGLAAGGQPAIAIERLVEQMCGHGVDHHVARPGIEGDKFVGLALAAESQSGCRCRRGSARSARSGDGDRARNRGRAPAARLCRLRPCRRDESRRPPARRSLPRSRGLAGLPGTGDTYGRGTERDFPGDRASGRGIRRVRTPAVRDVARRELRRRRVRRAAKFSRARSATLADLHSSSPAQTPSNFGRIGKLIVRQQFQAGAESAALDTHQCDIDAVGRGAAHDAGDDHCCRLAARQVRAPQFFAELPDLARQPLDRLLVGGGGAMRALQRIRLLLGVRERAADFSATSLANFLSLSAASTPLRRRAARSLLSGRPGTCRPRRAGSQPRRLRSDDAASTPPMSRSSVMMSPR